MIPLQTHVLRSHSIARKQAQSQNDTFSSPSKCAKLLDIFHAQIAKKQHSCTMQRSSLGATAFTFLCSIPSMSLDKENSENPQNATPVEFVLKWQSEQGARNEKMCADFLRSYGFNVPPTQICDPSISKKIAKIAGQKAPSMSTIADSMTLLAMPKLHANNFQHAHENQKIYQLSMEDQIRLFSQMAEIVPFDLAIGNNDRLLRFNVDAQDPFKEGTNFNTGNLMIEFNGPRLKKVHFIDNCTALDLSEKKMPSPDNNNFLGLSFEEELPALSDVQENPVYNAPDYKNTMDKMHRIFKRALNNREEFVDSVANSLIKQLDVRALKISEEALRISVAAGIDKGFEKLKTMPAPELAPANDPFNIRAQNLIELNLQAAARCK